MSAIIHPDHMPKSYLAGDIDDFGWGQTLDGTGLVVWKGDWHKIYPRVTTVVFDNGAAISINEWGQISTKPDGVWLGQDGMPYPNNPELPVVDEVVYIVDAPASAYTWTTGASGKTVIITRDGQSNEFPAGSSVVFYDTIVNLNHANQLNVYDYAPGSALRTALPDATKLVGFEPDGDPVTSPNGIQDVAAVAALEQLYSGSTGNVVTLAGSSAGYGWGPTLDGSGMVVWKGDWHQIVNPGTTVKFDDGTVSIGTDLKISVDLAGMTDTDASDNCLPGVPSDYGWGPTLDGKAMVVWKGDWFQIFERGTSVTFVEDSRELLVDQWGTIVLKDVDSPYPGAVELPDMKMSDFDYKLGDDLDTWFFSDGTLSTPFKVGQVVRFADVTIKIAANGTFTDEYGAPISVPVKNFGVAGQHEDYGWGPTLDGKGLVIWKGEDFHIFERGTELTFDDGTLTIDAAGKITFNDEPRADDLPLESFATVYRDLSKAAADSDDALLGAMDIDYGNYADASSVPDTDLAYDVPLYADHFMA